MSIFRTQTGQTGLSAYTYELAAIRNEFRELEARFAKLSRTIGDELPLSTTGKQSIATERFPDATMPVDAMTLRRQLEMTTTLDRFNMDQLEELIRCIDQDDDAFKPVDPIIRTADDFEAAAALLAPDEINAPIHVLGDLYEEAEYLRTLDLENNDGGITRHNVSRYLDTTRASRRATVTRWINRSGHTANYKGIREALDLIGGIGS